MASEAWLIAHRELQYLRAEAACTQPGLRHGERRRRRKYAGKRWKKWNDVRPRGVSDE